MYEIIFYKDKKGNEPIREYIKALASKTDKDSRIKLTKIQDCLKALLKYGKALGEPHVKHLDGEIWELRPLRDRVLFAAWEGNEFILLHHFMKTTQKTPRREIEKAKRNLTEYRERHNEQKEGKQS